MSVHKDYTLDYTSPLKDVILETESGSGGLTYRYTYGLQKVSTVISNVPNGAGELLQNGTVKLYYHHDRLGSTDFLTDNVKAKVTSYVEYDSWGALLSNAIVKLNQRELDLVQEYTGHPYDQVLGLYFAEARMYDAVDRRFVAMDLVKGTTSYPSTLIPYLYVLNNPIAFVDLKGKFLEGMNVTAGAKGDDIKDLAIALYEWEKRTTGITKHLTNYVNKEKASGGMRFNRVTVY